MSGFERREVLRDGRAVVVREIRPDDREAIAAAVRTLDPESIYMRLFSRRTELTPQGLERIMHVDPERDAMLVVEVEGGDGAVIAAGRYVGLHAAASGSNAEVAFVVGPDHRSLGISGMLLRHLAAIGRERGVATFEADVLAGNKAMLAVFARSGLSLRQDREGGVVHVTLGLRPGGG